MVDKLLKIYPHFLFHVSQDVLFCHSVYYQEPTLCYDLTNRIRPCAGTSLLEPDLPRKQCPQSTRLKYPYRETAHRPSELPVDLLAGSRLGTP